MIHQYIHPEMHEPFGINLNGVPHQIGSPIPENIEYLNVFCGSFAPQVRPEQKLYIFTWLNNVIDNFTGEYATYNGILVPREDLVKLG